MINSVSVGVPVWNGEKYLETCIASLLAQERRPDEIVISNNASTDGTAALADGIAAAESTVRVIHHQTNVGAAENFNGLVRRAETELFAWLPHDDVWAPELLGQLVAAHVGPDVAVAYGHTTFIDDAGAAAGEPAPAVWSDHSNAVARVRELFADPVRSHLHVCTPVLGLMRRDLLATTGKIRPFGGSDKVLIVEMALRGRLVGVDAPFMRRVHERSSVRANPDGESRRRWFDPEAVGPAAPESRLLSGFIHAVRDAPLSGSQRRQAERLVAAWALRGRRPRVLAGEVRQVAMWRARRIVSRG